MTSAQRSVEDREPDLALATEPGEPAQEHGVSEARSEGEAGLTRMAGQALHTIGYKLLTFVGRLLLLYVLAQTFSPEDYGAYALITTISTFAVLLLGFNLVSFVYRIVPGRPLEERVTILKSTLLFEVATASLMILLFVSLGLDRPVLEAFKAVGYETAFLLGLVIVLALIVAGELQHYLWAKAEIERGNRMDFLTQALWVLPLFALWKLGLRVSVTVVLFAYLCGIVLGVAYAASRIEFRAWWRAKPRADVIRDGLWFSVPMIVPALSFYLLKLGDRFLLSYFHSLEEVGLYSFAYTFINTIYAFTGAVVLNTMVPYAIRAHNEGALDERDRLLTVAFKTSVLVYLVAAGLLMLFAEPVMTLFARDEFLQARKVLPLIAGGYLMVVFGNPAQYLLMMEDRTRTILALDVASLMLGMVANFLLIPRYSYYGAGIATIIGFGVGAVLKHSLSRSWRHVSLPDLLSFRTESRLASSLFRHAYGKVRGRDTRGSPPRVGR